MLLNRDKQIFIGQRRDVEAAWQMPQGGVNDGEPLHSAARRELFEETGVTRALLLHRSKRWYRYDLPPHLMGKTWRGKYRGQKQKWFLMLFTGNEAMDINLEAFHYNEFKDWRWVDPEVLLDTSVTFKRDLYRTLLEEFLPRIQSLKIPPS